MNKYFGGNNKSMCTFLRYGSVLQQVNARLRSKGYTHSARINTSGKVYFHPLVAVEICLAHKLTKELGELEAMFEDNEWGHAHLFQHSTLHLLAAVAGVLDDERPAREKRRAETEALDDSISSLHELCKRLDDAVASVSRGRDQLEKYRADSHAAHSKAMAEKEGELLDMEERGRIKTKELSDANASLAVLHDMHTDILKLDFNLHKIRMAALPCDMDFRHHVISVLRRLYQSHPVYAMPVYYLRHFEWEVCDLVVNRLNLPFCPVRDRMGRVEPDVDAKVVSAVHALMSQL
eukprot:jgi/Mesvir1/22276/Mv17035-RA.1